MYPFDAPIYNVHMAISLISIREEKIRYFLNVANERTNSLAHEIKSGVKWFHYAYPHSLYICYIGQNPLVKIWNSRHVFVMPPSRETPPT